MKKMRLEVDWQQHFLTYALGVVLLSGNTYEYHKKNISDSWVLAKWLFMK
jgi:hypothetical protein